MPGKREREIERERERERERGGGGVKRKREREREREREMMMTRRKAGRVRAFDLAYGTACVNRMHLQRVRCEIILEEVDGRWPCGGGRLQHNVARVHLAGCGLK